MLEHYSNKIAKLIEVHKVEIEKQLEDFVIYTKLIEEVEEEDVVEPFLQADPPRSFEEYSDIIEHYYRLGHYLPVILDRTYFGKLFEVHRKDLIDHIVFEAGRLKELLLSKMVDDYQREMRE